MQPELFRFGSIADIQYGDFENGKGEGRCQRYREAPKKLEKALDIMHEHDVSLILTVGDIIEGHKPQSAADQADLDVITTIFSKARCPVAHTLGNHDVCLEREHLRRCLGMPACYYACPLHPGWKLLVLDTTDLSTGSEFKLCWPLDSPKYAEAKAYLDAHPQVMHR
ncbi:Metallo-dependent phosphatase-like protein [Dunaliella salina]|uniref:Metallo-dependent phosphatase-like protein n=1 Tax=Dunaliella salina TaxID=3046 RepID=A0ABQ7G976_DUNSA|nr:Metallo-dependent phosphatase-like protein [Dunaliella salina]|eukprot:KAF5831132.1 Metallo-dependent phosphatase-like protein [Dunaliella salina]